MAYVKQNWKNEGEQDAIAINKEHLNHIEEGIFNTQAVYLLAVTNIAPAECSVGDEYYDTEDNLIYTATDTNVWGDVGREALKNVFYVVMSENANYVYNGTTLVSVGAGGGATGDTLPVGTIIAYTDTYAPTGYLLCDGRLLDINTNPEYENLYLTIGTTFGSGATPGTFRLPNLKGRVIAGLDTSDNDFAEMGLTGGEKTHTLTVNEMPSHNHPVQYKKSASGSEGTFASGDQNSSLATGSSRSTDNTGGGQAHNNLQPYLVLNYFIKYQQSVGVVANVENTSTTSDKDVYSCNYVNEKVDEINGSIDELKPYVLFSGTNTGNITLSETSANFKFIEIYTEKSGCYGYTKVYNPNGKQFGIDINNAYGDTNIQQIFARYSISGTTMTKEHELYMNDGGNPTQSNDMAVKTVVGYK